MDIFLAKFWCFLFLTAFRLTKFFFLDNSTYASTARECNDSGAF